MIPILPESNPFFREDAAGFKHNERNKQSVSQKKLTKRIIRQTAQAITDFSMIEEGDKVMVAMSGGKDSYVLLDALRTLQKRAPISFELLAVTVNPHIPQFPAETLRAYFEAEGVPYHIEDQDIYSIIQKLIPEGKSVCSLCARLRRGVLYRLAGELGCTKIALGHHMDDIVGTTAPARVALVYDWENRWALEDAQPQGHAARPAKRRRQTHGHPAARLRSRV